MSEIRAVSVETKRFCTRDISRSRKNHDHKYRGSAVFYFTRSRVESMGALDGSTFPKSEEEEEEEEEFSLCKSHLRIVQHAMETHLTHTSSRRPTCVAGCIPRSEDKFEHW